MRWNCCTVKLHITQKMDFTLHIGTVCCNHGFLWMCIYITIQSKKEMQEIIDFKISYLIRGNNKMYNISISNFKNRLFQLCQQYQNNNQKDISICVEIY